MEKDFGFLGLDIFQFLKNLEKNLKDDPFSAFFSKWSKIKKY